MAGAELDYWDHATLLELAVLNDEFDRAEGHLANAVGAIRETWEPGTTANNLSMIRRARKNRGVNAEKLTWIIEQLESRAG